MSLASPPAVLPEQPASHMLRVGDRLVRFYDPRRGPWRQGRTFGPLSDLRFDHHLPPPGSDSARSVWYAATSLLGALSESFGRLGVVDREAGRRVALARVVAPIALLDLVGVGARSVGLTQEIAATTDYERTRRWARAFYDQYVALHGVRWRGRQAGSICIVLNDRAAGDALALDADHDLGDRAVWPRIARAARRCRLRVI